MGTVIALRRTPVNPAVVEAARRILELSEKGLLTTLIHIGVGPEGQSYMGIDGELVDDLESATEVASEGFSRLVGHKIEQRTEPRHVLPRRLRKKA